MKDFKKATTFSDISKNKSNSTESTSNTSENKRSSGVVRNSHSINSSSGLFRNKQSGLKRLNMEQRQNHTVSGASTNSKNVYLNNTPETKVKFKKLEPYRRVILNIINAVEDIYELDVDVLTGAPDKLKDAPIQKLNEKLTARIKFTTAGNKREKNKKASAKIASLLYIGYSMQFNNVVRLDFNELTGESDIKRYLVKFVSVNSAIESKKTDLNAILFLLDSFEKSRMIGIFEDVAYRLLRLFYILVLYDNLIDASVVASLILQQINKREGK